jgi:hypothetical protein
VAAAGVPVPWPILADIMRAAVDWGVDRTAAVEDRVELFRMMSSIGVGRPGREVHARSLDLLEKWLSPAQLEQYRRDGSFEVVGNATGARYRIANGANPFNVRVVGAREKLCFVPKGAEGAGDVMLAQKIALETDERAALAVANRTSM